MSVLHCCSRLRLVVEMVATVATLAGKAAVVGPNHLEAVHHKDPIRGHIVPVVCPEAHRRQALIGTTEPGKVHPGKVALVLLVSLPASGQVPNVLLVGFLRVSALIPAETRDLEPAALRVRAVLGAPDSSVAGEVAAGDVKPERRVPSAISSANATIRKTTVVGYRDFVADGRHIRHEHGHVGTGFWLGRLIRKRHIGKPVGKHQVMVWASDRGEWTGVVVVRIVPLCVVNDSLNRVKGRY